MTNLRQLSTEAKLEHKTTSSKKIADWKLGINGREHLGTAPITLIASLLGYEDGQIHEEAVNQLLQNQDLMRTPLCETNLFRYLVRYGKKELAERLIKHGFKINKSSRCDIATALVYFAEQGFDGHCADAEQVLSVIKSMLDLSIRIDFSLTGDNGLTALEQAFYLPSDYQEKFVHTILEAVKAEVLKLIQEGNILTDIQLTDYLKKVLGAKSWKYANDLMEIGFGEYKIQGPAEKQDMLVAAIEKNDRFMLYQAMLGDVEFKTEKEEGVALKKAIFSKKEGLAKILLNTISYRGDILREIIEQVSAENDPERFYVLASLVYALSTTPENNKIICDLYLDACQKNHVDSQIILLKHIKNDIREFFAKEEPSENKNDIRSPDINHQLLLTDRKLWEEQVLAWLSQNQWISFDYQELGWCYEVAFDYLATLNPHTQRALTTSDWRIFIRGKFRDLEESLQNYADLDVENITTILENLSYAYSYIYLNNPSDFTYEDVSNAIFCFLRAKDINRDKLNIRIENLYDAVHQFYHLSGKESKTDIKRLSSLVLGYLILNKHCLPGNPKIEIDLALFATRICQDLIHFYPDKKFDSQIKIWLKKSTDHIYSVLDKNANDFQLFSRCFELLSTIVEIQQARHFNEETHDEFDRIYSAIVHLAGQEEKQIEKISLDGLLLDFLSKELDLKQDWSLERIVALLNLIKFNTTHDQFSDPFVLIRNKITVALSSYFEKADQDIQYSPSEKIKVIDQVISLYCDESNKPQFQKSVDGINVGELYALKAKMFVEINTPDALKKAMVFYDLAQTNLKKIQTRNAKILARIEHDLTIFQDLFKKAMLQYKACPVVLAPKEEKKEEVKVSASPRKVEPKRSPLRCVTNVQNVESEVVVIPVEENNENHEPANLSKEEKKRLKNQEKKARRAQRNLEISQPAVLKKASPKKESRVESKKESYSVVVPEKPKKPLQVAIEDKIRSAIKPTLLRQEMLKQQKHKKREEALLFQQREEEEMLAKQKAAAEVALKVEDEFEPGLPADYQIRKEEAIKKASESSQDQAVVDHSFVPADVIEQLQASFMSPLQRNYLNSNATLFSPARRLNFNDIKVELVEDQLRLA